MWTQSHLYTHTTPTCTRAHTQHAHTHTHTRNVLVHFQVLRIIPSQQLEALYLLSEFDIFAQCYKMSFRVAG